MKLISLQMEKEVKNFLLNWIETNLLFYAQNFE